MKHGFRQGWVLLGLVCSTVHADWRADIGYTSLAARLGTATPTGAGVPVTHVEATTGGSPPIYHPDETLAQFSGKTFIHDCYSCNNENTTAASSGHATTVASNFYGNTGSIAPGITTIGVNEAGNWINMFLSYAFSDQPPMPETRRVQNHSWITDDATSNAASNDINRRLDLLLDRDGVVSIVGVNNVAGRIIPKNLGPAYNAIAVGLTSGNSSYGPVIAGLDGAGRVKPDIVAPSTATSWASPIVASAAALLLQTEEQLSILSSLSTSPINEQAKGKALLCKAILLAGATKSEFAARGGWRKGFATPNINGTVPLDYRFGAGELNIDNSHRILAVNCDSQAHSCISQDPSNTTLVSPTGWNYATITAATALLYFIEIPPGSYATEFSCILTWNRRIAQAENSSTLTPSLANLDLRFYAANGFNKGAQRDLSVSAIDNVEHIWLQNLSAGRYVLEVSAVSLPADSADWDYAIAWRTQITPDLLPPDLDHDADVDANDVTLLRNCTTGPSAGPPPSGCQPADFNGDNAVDQADFGVLQRCYSGQAVIANPACYQPAW